MSWNVPFLQSGMARSENRLAIDNQTSTQSPGDGDEGRAENLPLGED